jgi:arylsulfatase A-like enzyme
LARSAATLLLVTHLLPGCGAPEADPPPGFDATPPTPVLRLVELEATLSGEIRSDDALLAAWSGEQLAAWPRRADGTDVVISSPSLGRIRGVGAVELEIAPGGASRLELTPTMHGDAGDSIRRTRRVEVPLEREHVPGRAVQLRVDVAEAIGGNMTDTVYDPQLDQLDITVREPGPGGIRLDSVRLLRRDAVAEPFAARRAVAEIEGRLHPSWWVRGGAAIETELKLPAGEPLLRWFEGIKGDGAEPRVELEASGRSVAVDAGTDREHESAWRRHQASLANHAGERVRIRLSNAGTGIALFGDPRIVTRAETRPSDVLVYLIDTLRADHVGAFGAPYPGITPNLDRLIEQGVGFEMALAHSPWTKPSIATLMTGLLPTTHRVGSGTLSDRLPATVPVVQERFRRAGWRTGAFAANPLGSTLSGLERGFGTALAPRFWRTRPALGRNPSGAQIRKEMLRWLDEEPDRPFFAYLHVMEVHPSGRAHHGRGRPEGFTAYGASVRAADADLGALLEALAERGRDDLLVVVLSDHGDSRGVHGWRFKGHGTSLFQDQIHVPLVFWHPSGPPRARVSRPAGLADVAPTLLELFDLAAIDGADGEALDLYRAKPGPAPRSIGSSLIRFPHAPSAAVQHALVAPDHRKVLRVGSEMPLFFDLRRDPGETGPHELSGAAELLNELDQRIDALGDRAERFREQHGVAAAETIEAEELRRLRALGYVR